MSIIESFSEDPLIEIIQTSYENSSAEDHKKVTVIMFSVLPELTDEQARKYRYSSRLSLRWCHLELCRT